MFLYEDRNIKENNLFLEFVVSKTNHVTGEFIENLTPRTLEKNNMGLYWKNKRNLEVSPPRESASGKFDWSRGLTTLPNYW